MSPDVSPRPPFKPSPGTRVCSVIETCMTIGAAFFAYKSEWIIVVILVIGMFGMNWFVMSGLAADYAKYRDQYPEVRHPGNE